MSKKFNVERQVLKSHVLWRMINEMPSDCKERPADREECSIMWRIISGLPYSRERLKKAWQALEYKCDCIFCSNAKLGDLDEEPPV